MITPSVVNPGDTSRVRASPLAMTRHRLNWLAAWLSVGTHCFGAQPCGR